MVKYFRHGINLGDSGILLKRTASAPVAPPANYDVFYNSAGGLYKKNSAGTVSKVGDGVLTGPGSATDEAVTRFDGTDGETFQNSVVTIDDNGVVTLGSTTGHMVFPETATPSTPGGETVAVYASAGALYQLDSAGTATALNGSGWTSLTINNETSTSYTLVAADEGADVQNVYTGTANATWTLRAAATAGSGTVVRILNSVAYTLTVEADGAELISGELNVALVQWDSIDLVCSGTAWYLR